MDKKTKNERDIELILKAKSGDDEAINELMSLYKPLVTAISRKYFLINSSLDDIIQEGMLGLFKAYLSFKENKDKNFKNFATICIEHQIQNAIMSNNRNKNIPLNTYFSINNQGKILLAVKGQDESDDEEENGFYLSSNLLTPEESVLYKEKIDNVNKKINLTLSELEKKVLRLFVGGLTYVEIAKLLKKEPKSIDNALSRIKIKLKEIKCI